MDYEALLEEMQNRLQMLENQKAELTAEQESIREQMTWIRMLEERKHEKTV